MDHGDDKPEARGETIKVLLVDRQVRRLQDLRDVLSRVPRQRYTVDRVGDFEAAIDAMAADAHDVCLLGTHLEAGDSLEVLAEAVASGWRAPVILVVDEDHREFERDPKDLGAADYLVWDQIQPALLGRCIRYGLERKVDEKRLRDTKEDLIRRLVDLQDGRERAEAQSVEYVTLAEDLAIARSDLEVALGEVTAANQQLERLNHEKNKLFSIIAHDLRSPFTALLGFSEMIAQESDQMSAEQIADYGRAINEAGQRVFRLLENLLEWARLQMDAVEYGPASLDVRELAADGIALLSPVAAGKNVTVTNSVPAGLTAFADSRMINTVVRNLVNNAIKFTDDGDTIDVTARADGAMVEVTVSDTGVGMAADKLDRLFRMDQQTTTPGTKGEKGTGLGLLLCKDLIERNRGAITVESEEGAGSTFRVTLPATAPADEAGEEE